MKDSVLALFLSLSISLHLQFGDFVRELYRNFSLLQHIDKSSQSEGNTSMIHYKVNAIRR